MIATDGVDNSDPTTLDISFLDTNQAPTGIQLNEQGTATPLTSFNIPELIEDVVIGTLTTTDPDASDAGEHGYTSSDARFIIDTNGNLMLAPGVVLDIDDGPTVSVDITSADSDGLPFTDTFTFTVTNTNEAPVLVNPLVAPSVMETVAYEYTIPANAFTDAEGDTISYNITQLDGSPLPGWLQHVNGKLIVTEANASDANSGQFITLQVVATDGVDNSDPTTLDISFFDSNQAPTGITLTDSSSNTTGPFTVPEREEAFTIGTLNTSDGDINGIPHTYTTDDPRFVVDNNVLKLDTGVALNWDIEKTITLNVTSTDSDGATFTERFDIVVQNTNSPPTAQVTAIGEYPENASGDVVINVVATDQDASDVPSVVVLDAFGNPTTDFSVNSSNNIVINTPQNYESNQSVNLIVVVSDANYSISTPVRLNISDVNEAPSATVPSTAIVVENTVGQILPPVNPQDPDANANLSVSVLNQDGTVNPNVAVNADNSIELIAPLDAEIQQGVPLTVVVSDELLDTEYNFTLVVANTNEPPAVVESYDDLIATEAEPFSYTLSTSNFTDQENDELKLSISMANNEPLPTWLSYDANTHTLSGTPQDVDAGTILNILVTAFDGEKHSVSAATLQIAVQDVNQQPNALTLDNTNLPELSEGVIVGTLLTSDPDATDTTHQYSVSDSRFEVVNNELKLKEGESLDIDAVKSNNADGAPTLSVSITAIDSAGAALSELFTLTVDNINEAPELQSLPEDLLVSTNASVSLSSVVFIDPDQNEMTYTAAMANGDPLVSWLTFNPAENTITLGELPEAEKDTTSVDIVIIASDGEYSTPSAPLTLSIIELAAALPEAPTDNMEIKQPEAPPAEKLTPAVVTESNEPEAESAEPSEQPVEIDADIGTDQTDEAIDLASLIQPLEQIALVAIEETPTSITTIDRDITLDQIETLNTSVGILDLQTAFNEPSDIEFYDLAAEFDRQKEELTERSAANKTLIGSSFTISSGISVGYLLWLIRGGTLMGSVLSSLPAWRLVDPLPVLGSMGDDLDPDDESLESMVDNADEAEKRPPAAAA